jgi:hypothetical protein
MKQQDDGSVLRGAGLPPRKLNAVREGDGIEGGRVDLPDQEKGWDEESALKMYDMEQR